MSAPATPTSSFWAGRRVLVTGHTGFVGSWLSSWLLELGAEPWGLSRNDQQPGTLFARAGLLGEVRSLHADIRDRQAVADAVRQAAPEIVVHLAGQSVELVGLSDPLGTYATNVMGAVHLLDAVRRLDATRAVVVVTTDRCYETRPGEWPYRESDALGGRTPYASSKGCVELATRAFRRSFFGGRGPVVATARTGNLIGGGDWTEGRLVPDLLQGAVEGRPVRLRHPGARRPWQHVLDPICGYLLLAQALVGGGELPDSWNFGPGDQDVRAAGWVADRLAAQWGGDLRWEAEPNVPPDTAGLFRLDSSRAHRWLGWRVRWHVDRALEAVVRFQRIAGGQRDLSSLLRTQIADYVSTEA